MTSQTKPVIHIVPTSHASNKSSTLVELAINSINPDIVAVELDSKRYQKLQQKMNTDTPSNTSVYQLFRKLSFKEFVIFGLFSAIQKIVRDRLDISLLNIDMVTAMNTAEEQQIPTLLVDRDIHTTITRAVGVLSLRDILKMCLFLIFALVVLTYRSKDKLKEDVEPEDGESGIEELEKRFPEFKKVLIDERDEIISQKVSSQLSQINNTDKTIELVLVIGAGHLSGVKERLEKSGFNVNIVKEKDTVL